MENENKVNLCDSCLNTYPECISYEIQFSREENNNVVQCSSYKPIKTNSMPLIEDTEEFFPNRFLTSKEKALLTAKIIRYTATSIANTLPVEDRLNSKLADSRIIERFLTNCPESLVNDLFVIIGANIRELLTKNRVSLGLEREKPINIIN